MTDNLKWKNPECLFELVIMKLFNIIYQVSEKKFITFDQSS